MYTKVSMDLVKESAEFLRFVDMNKEEIKKQAKVITVTPDLRARCTNNFTRYLKEVGYNYRDNINICLLVNDFTSTRDFNGEREIIYLPSENQIQMLLSRFKSTYPSWLM